MMIAMTALAVKDGDYAERLLKNVPENYRKDAEEFIGFLKEKGYSLEEVSGWDAYLKHLDRVHRAGKLKGKRYSPSAYNHKIDAMKERLRYALDNDETLTVGERYAIKQQLDKIKRKKRAKASVGSEKVLSPKDISILLSNIRNKEADPRAHQIADMIELMYGTGIRISELTNILTNEIKKGSKEYYTIIIHGKAKKDRTIVANADFVERVVRSGATYLFPKLHENHGRVTFEDVPYRREMVTMRIKAYGRKYLNRDINAHMFRHTYATETIKETGRIKATSTALGHSSAKITMDLYVHDDFSDEELASRWKTRQPRQKK